MSILVYAETKDGKGTKSAFEAVSYAKKTSEFFGGDVIAITVGPLTGDAGLGNYGATKVLNAAVENADGSQIAKIVEAAMSQTGATLLIASNDEKGKVVAPRAAVRLNAGFVAGVAGVPSTDGGFTVKKGVFSGKATATVKIEGDKKVVSIVPNSFGVHPVGGEAVVEQISVDAGISRVIVKESNPTSMDGSIPLPEADLVVSAGRGMKGPENWGMIEELARELGAATACSRPVSDIGWRPHHEHVGQTGIAIRPTLYIAIGISGAIQHLAGVNSSKVIVVINKDSEAPFFKAADYGIVGDAFDVVPKLIEAVKAFKAN
jgi:electron transfer flavoprotein alpha subunit